MRNYLLIFFFVIHLIGFGNYDNKSFTFISSLKTIQKPVSRIHKDLSENEIKYVVSLDSFEKNGFIKKAQLLSVKSIFVHVTTKNIINKYNFYVMRYSVNQKLKTSLTKRFVVAGPLITNKLKQSFKTLTNGDSIIVHDIFADGPNGIEKLSNELIFVVKEI
jgi:hypothetical protein